MNNTEHDNDIRILLSTQPPYDTKYHTYNNVERLDISNFKMLEHILSIITSNDTPYKNISLICSNNTINNNNFSSFIDVLKKYNSENKYEYKIKIFGNDNIFWNDITEDKILEYKNNNITISFLLNYDKLSNEIILQYKEKLDYINSIIYASNNNEELSDKKQLMHIVYPICKETVNILNEFYQNTDMLPLITSISLYMPYSTVLSSFDYQNEYIFKNNIYYINENYSYNTCNERSNNFSIDLINNRIIKCNRMYDISSYKEYSDDLLLNLLKNSDSNLLDMLDNSICEQCKTVSKNRSLYMYYTNSF